DHVRGVKFSPQARGQLHACQKAQILAVLLQRPGSSFAFASHAGRLKLKTENGKKPGAAGQTLLAGSRRATAGKPPRAGEVTAPGSAPLATGLLNGRSWLLAGDEEDKAGMLARGEGWRPAAAQRCGHRSWKQDGVKGKPQQEGRRHPPARVRRRRAIH